MKKRISLKDIAQKVGVSTALVSYVLNGQKLDRIGKEVAQKIKEVAKEMNYATNQLAKSLKTRKTSTIGLVVADISNPFFSTLARIIEDEAAKNNYTVIFGSSDENPEKSLNVMEVLLNRQVDGLIIALAENGEPQIRYLQEKEIPFVLIDRYFPTTHASYVAIDNFEATCSLVRHVIEGGYTRIGLITYQTNLFHMQERKRGYLTALSEVNLPQNNRYIKEVRIGSTKEEVQRAVNDLLSMPAPVEAIVFTANLLSTCALKYINTLPLKVPSDLALASFDESDASYLFYAPLTHVKQPLKDIGQQAVKILLESIGGGNKVTALNMKAELVIGNSTLPVAMNSISADLHGHI